MYICIHTHIHIHIRIHMCIYIYICIHITPIHSKLLHSALLYFTLPRASRRDNKK